ncbi:hypothetical protein FHG87_019313 [Trinorchestia longiramus]|nr:hypothetical protein FHG87_019313 [Trinorchestia longiramus]
MSHSRIVTPWQSRAAPLTLDQSWFKQVSVSCRKTAGSKPSDEYEQLHEQCGENKWNARCVEEDSGMRYLVGLDEECNMTVVNAMKDFLVYAWNKRQGG